MVQCHIINSYIDMIGLERNNIILPKKKKLEASKKVKL